MRWAQMRPAKIKVVTMSDMKCPFCKQELRPLAIGWCCDCGLYADKELWQELMRTRKALDKAKNGLKELKDIIACPPDVSYETGVSMYADGVLQEITALEQKE